MKILKYLVLIAFITFVGYNTVKSFRKLGKDFKTGIAPFPNVTSAYYSIFPETAQ